MPYNIVFRESTWNWCYYLFCLVLISTLALFCNYFYKTLKLVLDRKSLAELAEKDKMTHAVNISVWFNFVLYLVMIIASLLVMRATYADMFNGFTEANITTDKVRLNYLWPIPYAVIPRDEIKSIESRKWGKSRMVLEITTRGGSKFKSASGYVEDVRQTQNDFSQALNSVAAGK